jgi:hypothetical protein
VNLSDIVIKTAAGAAEIASRSRKLPQRLRTMLILIDGRLTAGQLMEAGAKLGVPDDFLESLEQQGLVSAKPSSATPTVAATAPVDLPASDRFRAAQKFMNDTVVDALGLRAIFFTLKLEKCFNRADLTGLLDHYAKAIAKGSGNDVSRVLTARVREMLE